MLTISSIECPVDESAGAGAAADYVLARADRPAAFARGDYYFSDTDIDSDAPTVWHGPEAALSQLGVVAGAAVERDDLVAILQGRHARTGAQVRFPGNRVVERDGVLVVERVVKSVDLTFSVPKSVSVAWSQAGPGERARIEADVLAAARETIDFMATTKACVHRRTPDGDRVREPALGAAAALSVHVTARRAADDVAPAPQLHVHGVVVGLLRQDGRLVAPDPWKWFRDGAAREGGALGRAVLAERLAARGFTIESETGKHHRYFELRGVPESLRQALSGRSREVATRAKALELALGRPVRGAALAVLAKETRSGKAQLDHAQVAAWWDAVASEHGFGREQAEALRASGRDLPDAERERDLAQSIVRRIAAEGPTVSSAEARAITLECAAGRATPARAMGVLGRLQELGVVIALEEDRVTTKPVRELETQVLRIARTAAGETPVPLPSASVQAGIEAAERGLGAGCALDAEQRMAVEAICAGPRWSNLVGRAGTGKGPALEAVAHAHRAAGWHVLACAVDGTTAQRLAAQVHGASYTIDGLTTRVAHGLLSPDDRTLIIIDEASKVDSGRWSHLAQLVTSRGVRILAAGDDGQLQAIELPGLFAELCRATPTIELTEIRRHRDPDEPRCEHPWLGRYQTALHEGRGHDAVALLQEHRALRLHDTRAEAMVALVDDWDSWRGSHPLDETLMLVHGTNGDVDTVNLLAQARREHAGELGKRSVPAPDRDYRLRVGDLVVLRGAPVRLAQPDDVGRIENGTRMRVVRVDERRDTITVTFARAGAREGMATATIALAPLRRLPSDHRAPAIRLAYAMHPNPAQGATVARSATLGHPVADRNASYVADSRAVFGHSVHLAREDLGLDGTDADRLERYATTIAESRARAASVRYRRDERRSLQLER